MNERRLTPITRLKADFPDCRTLPTYLHRAYANDLERAGRNPTIKDVETLAMALSVRVSELLN